MSDVGRSPKQVSIGDFPMRKILIATVAVCAVVLASAADAQAGLFGKRRSHCAAKSTCCEPAPAPTCCAPAPAPTCCAPAPTCCAPAPSCCGSAPVSTGCGSCGGGVVYSGAVSNCPNCSTTVNSGVIMESATPQTAPPAPATTAPADAAPAAPATPAPDAAPSAPTT